MKAIGYARVSTQDQATEGVSLEAQEAKIRAYCLVNDLDLVAVVVDGGLSGKTTDREGLQQVLDLVDAGDVQAVVVAKLDRLSRRVVDTLALIETIEAAGVAFHSIAEKVDTKSAIGKFFLTITAAFAEMERNTIAERTAAALAHKQSIGEHVGSVPFGFKMDRQGGQLVPVAEEAAVVARAAELRASGMTLQAIADVLNGEGIPTRRGGEWRPCTVRALVLRAEAI